MKKWITALMQPSSRWSLFTLLVAGAFVGVIGTASFNYMVHETSTDEFCNLCHIDNIEPDYAGTVHSTNHIGVRVSCQDCHLPKAYFPKLYRKATSGARDTYHTIIGTIDTPEKFEAHRMAMAIPTWNELAENDSRACRYCHDEARWDLASQSEKARNYHDGPLARGKTCIDCHKGVAHPLPQGIEPDHELSGRQPAKTDTVTPTDLKGSDA